MKQILSLNRQIICIAIAALELTAHPTSTPAQTSPDTLPIAPYTRARAKVAELGPDWQVGRVLKISVSGVGECLAFSPDNPSKISMVTLNATDSLEVAVPGAQPNPDRAVDTWIGIPPARLKYLSRGCERSRP